MNSIICILLLPARGAVTCQDKDSQEPVQISFLIQLDQQNQAKANISASIDQNQLIIIPLPYFYLLSFIQFAQGRIASINLHYSQNRKQYMEKQNIKTSYLQYFPQRPATNHRPHRRPFSPKRTEPPKLLPHITEEYQYRITNHLLIKKIISPKRDKIIMSSLESIKRYKSNNSKIKTQSRSQWRQTEIASRSLEKRINRSQYRLKTTENNHKQHMSTCSTEPLQSNTPSRNKIAIIRNDFQKQLSDAMEHQPTDSTKMNSLIRSLHERRKQIRSDTLLTPETYGNGPTILCFTHIDVITNPPLKGDTLLQLELVQRQPIALKGYLTDEQQKVVRTHPIAFSDFPKDNTPNSKVKFALRISKIGDFVPLRLWKYAGVQCSELGTVDVPLSLYRLALTGGVSFMESQNVKWQGRAKSDLGRTVVNGEVACQLRRGNAVQIQSRVILRYKIYAKRFTKMKQISTATSND